MRHQDWPKRLTAYLNSVQTLPFAWGTHDCCVFAANVVREITGVDYAENYRGTYSTVPQAAKMLHKMGGVRGVATAALGDEINPKLAQRGDVVLVDMGEHGDGLGICTGSHCVGPGKDHLQYYPMDAAIAAWRVV